MAWGRSYSKSRGTRGYPPYVPVAVRKERAIQKLSKLAKTGFKAEPITVTGKKIANTFWGQSWCEHLESYSDFSNRLGRGRTYVRNGSVCHLSVSAGCIEAKVIGSSIYDVKIDVSALPESKWGELKDTCRGQVSSLLALLTGSLSENVMKIVTDREKGLFPSPAEIALKCSCPDWAVMCKHVAAVLYGVGSRLDNSPELLFLLRKVDVDELISADIASTAEALTESATATSKRIASEDLSDVFGSDVFGGVVFGGVVFDKTVTSDVGGSDIGESGIGGSDIATATNAKTVAKGRGKSVRMAGKATVKGTVKTAVKTAVKTTKGATATEISKKKQTVKVEAPKSVAKASVAKSAGSKAPKKLVGKETKASRVTVTANTRKKGGK